MFKRIKENELFIKLKEMWQNPRTHDMAVLTFWLIFIVVVIIFFRVTTGNTNQKQVQNVEMTTFSSIKSYDFMYKTLDKEINGSYYDGAMVFYLDNHRYYYNENVYLIGDESKKVDFDLGILKIDSKMLNNLTSGISGIDTGTFKQYAVPLDRFINLYEIDTDVDLTKAVAMNVIISVYYKNDEIQKVILDLSNYFSLKKATNVNYPVTIFYYNINNVSNFSKGYKEFLEVS